MHVYLYVCVYVCVFVRVYVHVHVRLDARVLICTCTCTCACMLLMLMCMCTFALMFAQICIHVYSTAAVQDAPKETKTWKMQDLCDLRFGMEESTLSGTEAGGCQVAKLLKGAGKLVTTQCRVKRKSILQVAVLHAIAWPAADLLSSLGRSSQGTSSQGLGILS